MILSAIVIIIYLIIGLVLFLEIIDFGIKNLRIKHYTAILIFLPVFIIMEVLYLIIWSIDNVISKFIE